MGIRDRHSAALEVGSMRVPTVGIAVATLCIVMALASTEEEHEVNYVKHIESLLDGADNQEPKRLGAASTVADVAKGAGCADSRYWARKSNRRVYKRYTSRCSYEKENGRCRRWNIKRYCSKTCTGRGRDNSYYSRPFSGPVMKKFSSRCAAHKGNCGSYYVKRNCRKTCTGSGRDSYYWSRPYLGPVTKNMSRCEHEKASGRCSKYYVRPNCRATCGVCTVDPKERKAKERKAKDPCVAKGSQWTRKHSVYLQKPEVKRFSSRCLAEKAAGRCSSYYMKNRYCKRTCTGTGKDQGGYWSRPYTLRSRYKHYKSRCEYERQRGNCGKVRKHCPVCNCNKCGHVPACKAVVTAKEKVDKAKAKAKLVKERADKVKAKAKAKAKAKEKDDKAKAKVKEKADKAKEKDDKVKAKVKEKT